MTQTDTEQPQEQQPLQVNPMMPMGDYDIAQERKDIAFYHRGVSIQRLTVENQGLQGRVTELEKALAEMVRERDGMKALIEKPKAEEKTGPRSLEKAS